MWLYKLITVTSCQVIEVSIPVSDYNSQTTFVLKYTTKTTFFKIEDSKRVL